jgi:hypothetical protein
MQKICYGGSRVYDREIQAALNGERNCRSLADAECPQCDPHAVVQAVKETTDEAAATASATLLVVLAFLVFG